MSRTMTPRTGNKVPLPIPPNAIQVSFFMDKAHHRQLRTYCAANDRDLSDVFREAAALFCKKETRNANSPQRD